MLGEYCLCNPKQVEALTKMEIAINDFNDDYCWDIDIGASLEIFLNYRSNSSSKLDIVVFNNYNSKSIRVIFEFDLIESIDDSIECAMHHVKKEFGIE